MLSLLSLFVHLVLSTGFFADGWFFGGDETTTTSPTSIRFAPVRLRESSPAPARSRRPRRYADDPDPCFEATLELLLLIDISSGTWVDKVDAFVTHLKDVLTETMDTYPSTRIALASFSDKPLPHVGEGTFGGYPSVAGTNDTCYQLNQAFADFQDATRMDQILKRLKKLGALGGLDQEEAQFEAILRAATDSEVRWSPVDPVEDRISRVIILFTDNIGHEGVIFKPARAYVDFWNEDITCPSDSTGQTTGGFGAQNFPPSDQLIQYTRDPANRYPELALLQKRKQCDNNLEPAEEARLTELWKELGPQKINALDDHPGDNSRACWETDYPSYPQITKALMDQAIKLIVLFVPPIQPDHQNNWAAWNWTVGDEKGLGKASPELINLDAQLTSMHDSLLPILNSSVIRWPCDSTPTPTPEPTTTSTTPETTMPSKTTTPKTTTTTRRTTTTTRKTTTTTREPTTMTTALKTTTPHHTVTTPSTEDCGAPDLEILFVMDMNARNWDLGTRKKAVEGLTSALKTVLEDYPVIRGSFAYYSDKGFPHCGAGHYGGFDLNGEQMDECYVRKGGLVDISSEETLTRALNSMLTVDNQRGNDPESALWEAVLRGALDDQWSAHPKTKRIIINFGDALGHSATFEAVGYYVDKWNQKVTCRNGKTVGGFGAQNFPPNELNYWIGDVDKYKQVQTKMLKKICDNKHWTADDEKGLQVLTKQVGPASISRQNHPGDASLGCDVVGYPAYDQVSAALLKEKVSLVILYVVKSAAELQSFQKLMSDKVWSKLAPVFLPLDSANYEKQIEKKLPAAIHKVAPFVPCPTTTTTELPTTTTLTTTEPTTAEPTTTEPTTTEPTTTEPTTTTKETTTAETTTEESTTDAKSTDETTGTPETSSTDGTETTRHKTTTESSSPDETTWFTEDSASTGVYVIPDEDHGGGTTAVVIAGAAGGAAGIVAAAAYALFVAPKRRASPAQEDSVEVTTQEYEREASALVSPVDFA